MQAFGAQAAPQSWGCERKGCSVWCHAVSVCSVWDGCTARRGKQGNLALVTSTPHRRKD